MSRRSLLLSSATLFLLSACAGSELPTSADPAGPALGRTPAVVDPYTEFTLSSDPTLGLQADTYSQTYAHGVCGVNSKIFVSNGGGDAIMHASNPKFRDAKCTAYPRKLLVNYGTETVSTSGQLLVDGLHTTMSSIQIGQTVRRAMNLDDSRCGGLKWRTESRDGAYMGGDSVRVYRSGPRTWHVYNIPDSSRALCVATGEKLPILVDFTITADRDMP